MAVNPPVTNTNNNMETNSESEEEIIKTRKLKRRRIQDEENPEFTHPTTQKKTMKTLPDASTSTLPEASTSSNIYNNLPVESLPTPPKETETEKPAQKSNKKPPPIHLYGRFDEQKKMDAEMAKLAPSGFYYKYIGKDSTLVFIEKYEEYKNVVTKFHKGKAEFHTYTPKQEKTHAFVLKGLCQALEIDEIKEELTAQKIKIKNIFKMKGTPEYAPAYLVVTDAQTTLSDIQRKVKRINHTVIRWERHYNNKIITQCHRCQRWGHATSNCYAEPACLKCGEAHITRECKKPINTPPKCANCGDAHLSNSTDCKSYTKALEKIKHSNQQPKQPTKYLPAPPPQTNVWENRRNTATTAINQENSTRQQIEQGTSQERRQINTQVSADPFNNFRLLSTEFDKLNHLINVEKMLSLVRQLNIKLENCKDNIEMFMTFRDFIKELTTLNLA